MNIIGDDGGNTIDMARYLNSDIDLGKNLFMINANLYGPAPHRVHPNHNMQVGSVGEGSSMGYEPGILNIESGDIQDRLRNYLGAYWTVYDPSQNSPQIVFVSSLSILNIGLAFSPIESIYGRWSFLSSNTAVQNETWYDIIPDNASAFNPSDWLADFATQQGLRLEANENFFPSSTEDATYNPAAWVYFVLGQNYDDFTFGNQGNSAAMQEAGMKQMVLDFIESEAMDINGFKPLINTKRYFADYSYKIPLPYDTLEESGKNRSTFTQAEIIPVYNFVSYNYENIISKPALAHGALPNFYAYSIQSNINFSDQEVNSETILEAYKNASFTLSPPSSDQSQVAQDFQIRFWNYYIPPFF